MDETFKEIKEIKKELTQILEAILKTADKAMLEKIYKLLVKLGRYE